MFSWSMITFLCILSGQISMEASRGMVLTGSPESNIPAMDMDFRLKAGISPDWSLFLSASFWKLENFHPTDEVPEFTPSLEQIGSHGLISSELGLGF